MPSFTLSLNSRTIQLAKRLASAVVLMFILHRGVIECRAAGLSWSGGGGANANWNNVANWGFAGTPTNGDTLIFSAGQPNLLNTNNIAGLTLNQIRFVGPGGGYDIRGNAFALTDSLEATNSSGGNTIENDITLAPGNQIIAVTNSLTLSGVLSGASGVIKNGPGTLVLSGPNSNVYGSTTKVNAGVLQLNKLGLVVAATAIPGNLVIGDGVSLATVQNLANDEIADTANVTINNNGTYDLNNQPETIGTNLTLHGNASVSVGVGTLTLTAPSTMNSDGSCSINGTGSLQLGAGPCVVNDTFLLDVYPKIQGAAAITKVGGGNLTLHGANTYTGQTVVSQGWLFAENSLALGAATSGTVVSNGATLVLQGGISISNEVLTLNGPGMPTWATVEYIAPQTNIWAGPIILNADSTFGGGALRIIGPISGAGGLQEIAGGFLSLEGSTSNTYAGTTIVSGTGDTLLLGKAAFVTAIPGPLVVGASNTVRLLNDFQMYNPTNSVTLGDSSLFDLSIFSEWVGRTSMKGARITSAGSGTYYFSGDITVNPSTIAQSLISGKAQIWAGTYTITNTGHNFSADLYIGANVSSGGSSGGGLIKAGSGEVSLGGTNSFLGPVTVNGGSLWAMTSTALGNTNTPATVNTNGTLFLFGGPLDFGLKPLILNGPGYTQGSLVGQGTFTWGGNVTLSSAVTIFSRSGSFLSLTGAISGAGSLIKDGPGTLTLSGAAPNTYAGLTTVNNGTLVLSKSGVSGAIPGNLDVYGTLRLGNNEQIPNTSDVMLEGGSVFDLGAFEEFIDTLRGSGGVTFGVDGYVGIGANGGSSTYSGAMSGTGYTLGGYTVAKVGAGTFTINGNSSYTAGATHVYQGKLIVNGSQPQIPVITESGTQFGGTGTVGTITANGVISPGSSPGVLTSSNVIFSSSGNFTVELTGPNPGAGGYDQLNVRGTNKLANATFTLIPAFTNPVSVGQQFIILNNDGVDAIAGTFSGLPEGAAIVTNGFGFRISYVGGSGNDVVLTLTNVPAALAGTTVSLGNGSGTIDPNECNYVNVVITNKAGTPITGITATLVSTTPYVAVTQPSSTYANVPANGKGTNVSPFQISTSPGFPCGSNINLSLTVASASHPTFSIPVTLTSGGPSAVSVRFNNNTGTNVPDVGTIESTNVVGAWSGGAITKVAASLWLDAPIDSDLNLTLIAPDGTSVDLSSGNGSGTNFGTGIADASRTTFDDAAGTSITAGSSPFVGTFQPESPLSALIGTSPAGAWRLRVQDNGFFGNPDTLHAWSLFLYGTACAPGGGLCELCPNVTIYSATGPSSLVQSNFINYGGIPSVCGVAGGCPGTFNAPGPFPSDNFTFRNGPSDACVTVAVADDSSTVVMLATAYLGSYDQTNGDKCINYLADGGNVIGGSNPTQSFSFNVASNAIFVVNIIANTPLETAPYHLTVSGGDCRPVLNITPVNGNNVTLDWTTAAAGYVLERTNKPVTGATNWQSVTNVPAVVNSRFQVTNGPASGNQFYRLHKP